MAIQDVPQDGVNDAFGPDLGRQDATDDATHDAPAASRCSTGRHGSRAGLVREPYRVFGPSSRAAWARSGSRHLSGSRLPDC